MGYEVELLKHEPHFAPPVCDLGRAGEPGHVDSVHAQLAAVRLVESADQIEQRALATAAGSANRHYPTGRNAKADAVHRPYSGRPALEMLDEIVSDSDVAVTSFGLFIHSAAPRPVSPCRRTRPGPPSRRAPGRWRWPARRGISPAILPH